MNVSYILKSHTATERHVLEHLFLYRSKNYPVATTFYSYLLSLGVEQYFASWYEYMEITFYNVTDSIIKVIDLEMSSWYFTKEDFELEKRVILIEASNYNKDKVELDINNLFMTNRYRSVCDAGELEDIDFVKLIKIKDESIFEKVIFNSREVSNTDQNRKAIKESTKSNFVVLSKKENKEFVSFNIEHDTSLYDLAILLAWFFDYYNYFYSRLLTIYENTLVFKKSELEFFKNNFENILNDKYNYMYSKTFPSQGGSSNSVNYKLKNFINIDDVYKKEQIKNMLIALVNALKI